MFVVRGRMQKNSLRARPKGALRPGSPPYGQGVASRAGLNSAAGYGKAMNAASARAAETGYGALQVPVGCPLP